MLVWLENWLDAIRPKNSTGIAASTSVSDKEAGRPWRMLIRLHIISSGIEDTVASLLLNSVGSPKDTIPDLDHSGREAFSMVFPVHAILNCQLQSQPKISVG